MHDEALFEDIREYIDSKIFDAMHADYEKKHAGDVLKHIDRIWADAPVAVRTASYCHDIQRVFIDNKERKSKILKKDTYEDYKLVHAETCARLASIHLDDFGLDMNLVSDVSYIITNHEYGPPSDDEKIDRYTGSYDLNYAVKRLVNCDARAFFEEYCLQKYLDDYGIEGISEGKGGLKSKTLLNYTRMDGQFREDVMAFSYSNKKLEKIVKDIIRSQFRPSG